MATSASTWSRYTVDDGLESFGREDITGEVTSVASSGGASFLAGTYGVTSTSAAALVAKRPYWPAVLNELTGTHWQARVFERSGMVSSIATDAEGRTWVATSLGGMARDTNFYYSFLVLPPAKRRAIVGVWDFCRAVDDAVDEADPRDVQVRETPTLRIAVAAKGGGCFRNRAQAPTRPRPRSQPPARPPGTGSRYGTDARRVF